MSAALSFQLASNLGPSPDEREEFAAKIRSKDAELEELREAKQSGAMKPQERQALNILLSDIREENKKLIERAEKQAKEIEDLQNVNDQLNEKITSVKGLAKDRIGELLAVIVDIQSVQNVDRKYVNNLVEELGEIQDVIAQHAEAINKIHQATRKIHAPNGKKSKARVDQLKEILKGGSKTYKDLERLLKISPKEMNRLVSMLDTRSYEIFFRSGDNRQKVLRLRSLTSNVKYSQEGDSKAVQLLKV
jgi:DNA repair exonuclease SbcCD ATPase subunit